MITVGVFKNWKLRKDYMERGSTYKRIVYRQEVAVALKEAVRGSYMLTVYKSGKGWIRKEAYELVLRSTGAVDVGCQHFSRADVRKIRKWANAR